MGGFSRLAASVGSSFAVLALSVAGTSSASAAVAPLGIPCTGEDGVRVCRGDADHRVSTFDGIPLDANVFLPGGSASDLPLVVELTGYPGDKIEVGGGNFLEPRDLANAGYAVLSLAPRGNANSCGFRQSTLEALPQCVDGYMRIADSRYEVRDVQYLSGLLADEGFVDGQRIGLVGESYGAGQILQLATLRDRIRLPDGSYAPWRSPGGLPMQIAAAVPIAPWSDLAYALAPNGRDLDYVVDDLATDRRPVGVLKQSYLSALIELGANQVYEPPPGLDPRSDLLGWYAALSAGEPYGQNPLAEQFMDELSTYHSAYGISPHGPPAPTLVMSAFTDDLFPVDEAQRWMNRVAYESPGSQVAAIYGDFGHPRSQGKPGFDYIHSQERSWLDHYLGVDASAPVPTGFTAWTQTCPITAPPGGPYHSETWAGLHPGEVRTFSTGTREVLSSGGDPAAAAAVDPVIAGGALPVGGGGEACTQVHSVNWPGTASYRVAPARAGGYTLLGSPTVIARLDVTGAKPNDAQLAARLWDLAPDGSEVLVARSLYRPRDGRQVFQLHPGAYHFARGHVAKLELLGNDAPYGRASNLPFDIAVSDLRLRLPVAESPDGAQIRAPAAHVLPNGATPAPGT